MLTRDEFLALLARLHGDGDALTAAEFGSLQAYIAENADDREALTDDEAANTRTAIRALAADDVALSIEDLEAAVELNTALAEAIDARATADEAAEARRAELRAALAGPAKDPEPEPEIEVVAEAEGGEGGDGEDDPPADEPPAEGDEPAEEPEAELVGATAAAPAPVRPRTPTPSALRNRRPGGAPVPAAAPRGNMIQRDTSRGSGDYDSLAALAEDMVNARQRFMHAPAGFVENMVLGSVIGEYDAAHTLDFETDAYGSQNKLSAVVDALWNRPAEEFAAVTASGGLCGPSMPYYGLQQLAVSDRPFAASLQRFANPRGAIVSRVPPSFPSFASAVGVWTETNDTLPGSDGPATKPCMVVPCNDTREAVIYAVTECLKFGNFMARTDPETVANVTANTAAAFARKAEVLLIDAVKAASTAVTAGDALGAYSDLTYHVGVLATGMRSRLRMRMDAVLELRLPYWVRAMILSDLRRRMPGDGTLAGAGALFDRALAEHNVRLAGEYMDSPTTGQNQVFGPQPAGATVDYPATVQWHLAVPGSIVMLDNGRLDLGIVRDSTLIGTNDFITFGESFEGIANLGQAGTSLWVTSTVCPNGSASGLTDPSAFCATDYLPA